MHAPSHPPRPPHSKLRFLRQVDAQLQKTIETFRSPSLLESAYKIIKASFPQIDEQLSKAESALKLGDLEKEAYNFLADAERRLISITFYFNILENAKDRDISLPGAILKLLGQEFQGIVPSVGKNILIASTEHAGLATSEGPEGYLQLLSDRVEVDYFPTSVRNSVLFAPLLAHEFAHNLLFLRGDVFFPDFDQRFSQIAASLQQSALAVVGPQRDQFTRKIEFFIRQWEYWKHEIGADLIAFHLFGPAYLSAFALFVTGLKDPFQPDETHPPDDARVRIMFTTADDWEPDNEIIGYLKRWWSTHTAQYSAEPDHPVNENLLYPACKASILKGCAALGISPFPLQRLDTLTDENALSMAEILNVAALSFLSDSQRYPTVEERLLPRVKTATQ
jgi:hypothetical protein